MKDIYAMIGITKQAFYKRLKSDRRKEEVNAQILDCAAAIRAEHTRIGCRKIHSLLENPGMGRDRTEQLLLSKGFRLQRKRSYHRTTYAGKTYYENLITGLELRAADQLWVSDMTYIGVGYRRNYYLTLILDVYTRRIKGWSLSDTMRTEDTVLPAFEMAARELPLSGSKKPIFHSDKGAQYGSDLMREVYEKYGVTPSMGGKAWENAHAESLNGILKNEYIHFGMSELGLKKATRMVKNWIYLYNHKRPHGSLGNMKPWEYEIYIERTAVRNRPLVTINY